MKTITPRVLTHGGEVTLKLYLSSQADIDAAVKSLLALKAEYKSATGKDWKPGQAAPVTTTTPVAMATNGLTDKIAEQGNKVRDLKAAKANKVGRLTVVCHFWLNCVL